MQTYVAEVHELVRSHRRDEEHLKEFEETINQIIKDLLGDRFWIRAYRYIGDISRLVYYSTTNLSGVQTVGEEYVGLVQVYNSERRILPSNYRRLIFTLLESFRSRVLDLISWILNYSARRFHTIGFEELSTVLLVANSLLKQINIDQVENLHIAFFYLFGTKFYELSKRISNISYLSFRPQSNIQAKKLFQIVGLLSFAQTLFVLIGWIFSIVANRKTKSVNKQFHLSQEIEKDDSDTYNTKNLLTCGICLEQKPPTSTPCGHLFCYNCLIEHSKNLESSNTVGGQCPQCRRQFPLSRIVPLFNFAKN